MSRKPRSRARRAIGAAAVGTMLLGALVPALQLSGTSAAVTAIAAVVAAALMTVYVVYDGGALTGAVVVGLTSCAFGATSGDRAARYVRSARDYVTAGDVDRARATADRAVEADP